MAISEREFMAQVIQLANLRGWLVYHTHDSRHSASGFPDLVLVRRERLAFAELKAENGKMRDDQRIWQQALNLAGQASYVWRPCDWDFIADFLA